MGSEMCIRDSWRRGGGEHGFYVIAPEMAGEPASQQAEDVSGSRHRTVRSKASCHEEAGARTHQGAVWVLAPTGLMRRWRQEQSRRCSDCRQILQTGNDRPPGCLMESVSRICAKSGQKRLACSLYAVAASVGGVDPGRFVLRASAADCRMTFQFPCVKGS